MTHEEILKEGERYILSHITVDRDELFRIRGEHDELLGELYRLGQRLDNLIRQGSTIVPEARKATAIANGDEPLNQEDAIGNIPNPEDL